MRETYRKRKEKEKQEKKVENKNGRKTRGHVVQDFFFCSKVHMK